MEGTQCVPTISDLAAGEILLDHPALFVRWEGAGSVPYLKPIRPGPGARHKFCSRGVG